VAVQGIVRPVRMLESNTLSSCIKLTSCRWKRITYLVRHVCMRVGVMQRTVLILCPCKYCNPSDPCSNHVLRNTTLYGPFCHGALKHDISTLFTTFFVCTSLQFIFQFYCKQLILKYEALTLKVPLVFLYNE